MRIACRRGQALEARARRRRVHEEDAEGRQAEGATEHDEVDAAAPGRAPEIIEPPGSRPGEPFPAGTAAWRAGGAGAGAVPKRASKSCLASGAAARSPWPPFSTKTTTTIRGSETGAEGREPRMVLQLGLAAPARTVASRPDDLRRARLAADLDARHARAVSRAAGLVHDGPHSVLDDFQLLGSRAPCLHGIRPRSAAARRSSGPETRRRGAASGGARPRRGRRAPAPTAGTSRAAGPVRWRPRSSRSGTSGSPALRARPLLRRHEARLLEGEVDAGRQSRSRNPSGSR